MTETAEATTKVAKKRPAKKAATKTARKPAAQKAPRAATKKAPATTVKRGRPPGKKTARKTTARRSKKAAKVFAYMLLTPQEDNTMKAGSIQGPFMTENGAVEDASIMAEENTQVVLFREAKRGRVQKSTKFVAGR